MVQTHRFQLVLPKALFARIKALAKLTKRSTTQEIVVAIEEHIETETEKQHGKHPDR